MRGIWRDPILPGQSYLNTKAYEVTKISTRTHVVRYTVSQGQQAGVDEETRNHGPHVGRLYLPRRRAARVLDSAAGCSAGGRHFRRRPGRDAGRDEFGCPRHLSQQCRRREGTRLRQAAFASGIAIARNAAKSAVEEGHYGLGGAHRRRRRREVARHAARRRRPTAKSPCRNKRRTRSSSVPPSRRSCSPRRSRKPRKKSGWPRPATK